MATYLFPFSPSLCRDSSIYSDKVYFPAARADGSGQEGGGGSHCIQRLESFLKEPNSFGRGFLLFLPSSFLPGTRPRRLDFEQPSCDHKAVLKPEARA